MSDDNRAQAALRDFIAELNAAWEAAGPPSYARLEKLSISFGSSEQAGGLRLRVLAASTTHEILRGKRRSLPEWGWVVSFANVLRFAAVENGLDPEVIGTVADWKARHQHARMLMRADPDDTGGDPDADHDPDHDPDRGPGPGHRGSSPDRGPPSDDAVGGMTAPGVGISGAYPFRIGRGSRHHGQREREGPAATGRPARRGARPGGGRGARLRRGADAVAE